MKTSDARSRFAKWSDRAPLHCVAIYDGYDVWPAAAVAACALVQWKGTPITLAQAQTDDELRELLSRFVQQRFDIPFRRCQLDADWIKSTHGVLQTLDGDAVLFSDILPTIEHGLYCVSAEPSEPIEPYRPRNLRIRRNGHVVEYEEVK